MNEFKTLNYFRSKNVSVHKLRAEAIKIHNAGTFEIMEYLELTDISKREIELLRKFLKKFYNLTNEDLK